MIIARQIIGQGERSDKPYHVALEKPDRPGYALAMKREHISMIVFAALIVVIVYLFYRVVRPFLPPIIWGAILAGVFYPLNARFGRRIKRNNLRAFLLTLIVVAVIIVPAILIGIALVGEVGDAYPRFRGFAEAGHLDFVLKPQAYGWNERVRAFLAPYVNVANLDVESFISSNIQHVSNFFIGQVSNLIGNLSLAIVNFVFCIFSMFYVIRDGDRLAVRARELLPMSEDLKANLTGRLNEVVHATIYGGILVAGIQGTLGALLFWAVGIHTPLLWGATMALLALIPLFGPYVIYVPAAVILIATGSMVKGIILLVLGVAVVSQVDNLLKPLIVGSRTKIHPLIVFFSMLGGLKAFGLLGVILGPVLASILLALLEVYKPRTKSAAAVDDQPPTAE
jgi:predicted PurR-regulated permease PerM